MIIKDRKVKVKVVLNEKKIVRSIFINLTFLLYLASNIFFLSSWSKSIPTVLTLVCETSQFFTISFYDKNTVINLRAFNQRVLFQQVENFLQPLALSTLAKRTLLFRSPSSHLVMYPEYQRIRILSLQRLFIL